MIRLPKVRREMVEGLCFARVRVFHETKGEQSNEVERGGSSSAGSSVLNSWVLRQVAHSYLWQDLRATLNQAFIEPYRFLWHPA